MAPRPGSPSPRPYKPGPTMALSSPTSEVSTLQSTLSTLQYPVLDQDEVSSVGHHSSRSCLLHPGNKTLVIIPSSKPPYTTLSIICTYVALSDPGSMKCSYILEQSPRDWETTMHQNVVLKISPH